MKVKQSHQRPVFIIKFIALMIYEMKNVQELPLDDPNFQNMIITEELLDTVSSQAKESPRLRMNYNLHEHLDDKVHRFFNAMEPGTIVPVHRHRDTAETFMLVRGKMRVVLYDDDKKEYNRRRNPFTRLWQLRHPYPYRSMALGRYTGTQYRYIRS